MYCVTPRSRPRPHRTPSSLAPSPKDEVRGSDQKLNPASASQWPVALVCHILSSPRLAQLRNGEAKASLGGFREPPRGNILAQPSVWQMTGAQ